MNTTLPAPPTLEQPQQPPVKKSHRGWKIAGIIIAGLFMFNLVQDLSGTSSSTSTNTTPGLSCIDTDRAVALIDSAHSELQAAAQAANAGDVATASSMVRAAADDLDEIALATLADPEISGSSSEAATHLNASAGYLDSGNYTLAISEMNAAGDSIVAANSATLASDVPAC
jgi:hypothetical protein